MNKTIAIDARWLVGGIGTYTRHLLRSLHRMKNGFRVEAITQKRYRHELEDYCDAQTIVNLPIYTFREQWMIPRAAARSDLLHVPHYNAPLFERAPVVITLHDIIHLTDPHYRNSMKSWLYARPLLNVVVRKARRIITVSEYSKEQIVERLGVPPSKITTIYNGVNGSFKPMNSFAALNRLSQELGIQGPYILYVGSLKRYKNVSALLKAFAMLAMAIRKTHHLLIVGDDKSGTLSLLEEADRLNITSKVRFLPHVGTELLPLLYAGADVHVMPSKVEGFGLPVLEAMACGTPVVCSSAASLPEIGGDAVVYFDPNQPEDLAACITRVLDSTELRHDLRRKGLERATLFTWEESGRKHLQVYKQVLDASRD